MKTFNQNIKIKATKSLRKLKNLIFMIATATPLLCLVSNTSFAGNYPWPTTNSNTSASYFYYSGDTLREGINKLAKTYNVTVRFSDDVSAATLNTKISGNFKVSGPTELLNKFGSLYGFSWFYYSNAIWITSNVMETASIPASTEDMDSIRGILVAQGILDDKFGFSEAPNEGMVVVSGPRDYVKIVSKKIKELNITPVGMQFAVFRLKYASAVDTTVNLKREKIILPGVATILVALLQGEQNVNSGSKSRILRQVIEPLKNNLKGILPTTSPDGGGSNEDDATMAANSAAGSTALHTGSSNRSVVTRNAIIQADARLNTIVIRDKESNLGIYKSLINLLDVPAPLIQIEVLIADIDQEKMNQAGINWWGSTGPMGNFPGVSGGFGSNNLTGSRNASSGNSTPTMNGTYGNVNQNNLIVSNVKNFSTGLQFLQQNGYAKTKSKSAVVTIDNIAAVVNLSQSFYAQTLGNTGGANLAPVESSMVMQVTPHLVYEGERKKIKLVVNIEDGNVENNNLINGLPTTLQGSLNSQAVIDAGKSLLMAGFSRSQTTDSETKIPLLGDIPVIGWLFKQKTTTQANVQRFYLVTPEIVWYDNKQKIPGYSTPRIEQDLKTSLKDVILDAIDDDEPGRKKRKE